MSCDKIKDIIRTTTQLHFRFELRDATTGLRKPGATGIVARFLQNSAVTDVSADVVEIADGFYEVLFAPNVVGQLFFYVGADGCQDSTSLYCVHDFPYGFTPWGFVQDNAVRLQSGANIPASGQ